MRTLFNQPNVNKSDLVNFPSGRIKDNDGTGNGTAVNEATKGDLHQMLEKLMRLSAITPNDLPDSEGNGYQLIEALRGLASKNDFIYPLGSDGTFLSVNIKVAQMLEGEFIVCLASVNKGAETQIKGIGSGSFTIAYSGSFKTNEYVRVIKTSAGVSIIRIADWLSLDAMATDLFFLKKASQVQEDAGLIESVATTPLSNLTAFVKRVIGADSGSYLAKPTGDPDERNGLLSKSDKAIIDGIGASPIRNTGWFSDLSVGTDRGYLVYPVSGDIVSVTPIDAGQAGNTAAVVVMANAMDNLNYKVNISLESEGIANKDNDCYSPVFKKIDLNTFHFWIAQAGISAQNIKVHLEVVQL